MLHGIGRAQASIGAAASCGTNNVSWRRVMHGTAARSGIAVTAAPGTRRRGSPVPAPALPERLLRELSNSTPRRACVWRISRAARSLRATARRTCRRERPLRSHHHRRQSVELFGTFLRRHARHEGEADRFARQAGGQLSALYPDTSTFPRHGRLPEGRREAISWRPSAQALQFALTVCPRGEGHDARRRLSRASALGTDKGRHAPHEDRTIISRRRRVRAEEAREGAEFTRPKDTAWHYVIPKPRDLQRAGACSWSAAATCGGLGARVNEIASEVTLIHRRDSFQRIYE